MLDRERTLGIEEHFARKVLYWLETITLMGRRLLKINILKGQIYGTRKVIHRGKYCKMLNGGEVSRQITLVRENKLEEKIILRNKI